MLRPAQHFVPLFLLSLGLLPACNETTGPVSLDTRVPTTLQIHPADFLGDVPCLEGERAMRSYVATLRDVTPPSQDGGVVATEPIVSPRTPCQNPVAFLNAIPWHRYLVHIDAFDDIRAEARWSTDCGRPTECGVNNPAPGDTCDIRTLSDVTCLPDTILRISYCRALVDRFPGGDTVVWFDGAALLPAELSCGPAGDQVSRYEVALQPNGERLAAPCGERLDFPVSMPGTALSFRVTAFSEGATLPSWGTTCQAKPVEHVGIRANCAPLAPGSVTLPIPDLLASLGEDCDSTNVKEILAWLDPLEPLPGDPDQRFAPPYCNRNRTLPLSPGPHRIKLHVNLRNGATREATCTAELVPGVQVTATCSAP